MVISSSSCIREIVGDYCTEIRQLGLRLEEAISESLGLDKDYIEALVNKTKGGSKKNSTKRDLSAWEYIFSRFRSCWRCSSSISGRGRGRMPSTPKKERSLSPSLSVRPEQDDANRFPFAHQLPSFLLQYITTWHNIKGDGNCGFCVVADVIYRNEDKWATIRKELCKEIEHRKDLYQEVFGSAKAISTVMKNLCHFTNTTAPRNTWMSLVDLGLVIATKYDAAVLELSDQQSFTYLPLVDGSKTGKLSCIITFAFLREEEHFVRISLKRYCPLPPIFQVWNRYRDDSVAYLEHSLANMVKHWKLLSS